jgi:class 3 adenylate cyclase
MVIEDAVTAAAAALELSAMVTSTDWSRLGLPSDTNIRIAVHAGPVYEVADPITKHRGFAGMHISRAARIEPVTPPGEVYVSEAFAGLLEFDDHRDQFMCEFVGTVPMAKEYGRFRTYRLAYR